MFPLSDTKTSGRFPTWVVILILTNVWVFFQELTALNPDLFVGQFALIPSQVDFSNLAVSSLQTPCHHLSIGVKFDYKHV